MEAIRDQDKRIGLFWSLTVFKKALSFEKKCGRLLPIDEIT